MPLLSLGKLGAIVNRDYFTVRLSHLDDFIIIEKLKKGKTIALY